MRFLKTIERDTLKLDIQLMDTLNEEEINNFLISFYKSFGLRSNFNFNWFNWFYNENPLGKCRNYILTNENRDIVGGFGYSLFNYSFKGVSKIGVIGINGFINPDYTGLGLYTQLISETLKDVHRSYDLAFSFPHSDNKASIKGHINSDWKHIKKLDFYVKKINSEENLHPNKNIIISKIEALKEFDFNSSRDSFFIKNYERLDWRFYKRPDKNYKTLIYKRNNNIIGYIIYTLYNDKDGSHRCQVADYDYLEKIAFIQLIDELSLIGKKYNYSTIEFLVNEDHSDTKVLTDLSFVKKKESYEMFINGSQTGFNETRNFKFEFGYFDVI